MLLELIIRDLALIEEVELGFGAGLNAISGETGAGKSLLVGALELLLGERPRGKSAGWVRAGAERAWVEGRFALGPGEVAEGVRAWLAEHLPVLVEEFDEALDPDRGEGEAELIAGRTLYADGRTRAHLNHRPVALKRLRGLVALLLEIHGQNDHQKLLDPGEQLRLLDAFGGLGESVAAYAAGRAAWRDLLERVENLEAERTRRVERLDYLRYQVDELERARPRSGEKGELLAERDLLRNAGDLGRELGGLVQELAEDDEALVDRLRRHDRLLTRWREHLPALDEAGEELRGALVHLEETAAALTGFLDGVEDDPRRLEEVEERLAELERLELKHRCGADGLAEILAALGVEIEELESQEQEASGLIGELARARAALAERAGELGRARRKLAAPLARAVQGVLADLGLAAARFELRLEPRASASPNAAETPPDGVRDLALFGPRGAERAEFFLAANPGEPLQPLRQVISGGEAARFMLALRTVLAACDRERTLVFDEVDAGVGGRLGPAVGRHLRALGEHHQVLCVTHLPAIAALADTHLRVGKQTRKGRTRTSVRALEGPERVEEIADMIAGGADEETARAEARRLLAAGPGA